MDLARPAAGALLGAIAGAVVGAATRPLFGVPGGGVGYVTLHQYPKRWDYAMAALIVLGAFAGGALLSRKLTLSLEPMRRPRWLLAALVTAAVVFFLRDDPSRPLDFFHEGETLTPAFALRSGARPYGEIFFSHGLGADGGVQALLLGDHITPESARRLEAILSALTLALLAPIAAQVCATAAGVWAGVAASLCAIGVAIPGLFPHYRLAPVLIATLALLRYVRASRKRWLAVAMCASAAGLVWSLDAGLFALAGTLAVTAMVAPRRLPWMLPALALPLLILLVTRSDVRQFAIDSFVTVPRSVDAIGSLPARRGPAAGDFVYWLAGDSARYYAPLVVYGLLLALAWQRWRSGDRPRAIAISIVTVFALLLFRAAAGRADLMHIRFAMPLFGIAVVAFLLEPLARQHRLAAVVAALFFASIFNVAGNVEALLSPRRTTQRAEHPVPPGRFFDFSNSLAMYALAGQRPPVRCPDVKMLSIPALRAEAMAQLQSAPPDFVILKGYTEDIDSIPNSVRVPELARWIDEHYPNRKRAGELLIATR